MKPKHKKGQKDKSFHFALFGVSEFEETLKIFKVFAYAEPQS
jgi:hypothetical protein